MEGRGSVTTTTRRHLSTSNLARTTPRESTKRLTTTGPTVIATPTPVSGARGTSSAATIVGTGITITTAVGKHSQTAHDLLSADLIVSALFVHSLASLWDPPMTKSWPGAPL